MTALAFIESPLNSNIQRWLSSDAYYNLTDDDRYLLENFEVICQMFKDSHRFPADSVARLNKRKRLQMLRVDEMYWAPENPKLFDVTRRSNYWIADRQALEVYKKKAITLLAYNGNDDHVTSEMLEAAEWFLHLKISPFTVLRCHSNISASSDYLYRLAVWVHRGLVEKMYNALMRAIAHCQEIDARDSQLDPHTVRMSKVFKTLESNPCALYGD